MSLLDETVEVPRRTMTLFFLIGTSGSMDGRKIGAVNESMREVLPMISDISAANPDAEINVAVLQFSKGASGFTRSPSRHQTLNGMTYLQRVHRSILARHAGSLTASFPRMVS